MIETLIIDKDNINLLLKTQSVSWMTKTAIIDTLFATTNIDTYILGPAWVGKSISAKGVFWGVYTSDIKNALEHVQSDKPTIVINSTKPDPKIADLAKEIYIFDAPPSRIYTQKLHRWQQNDFTNFGRTEKATLWASTDNSFNKAILKRDHPNKTFIYQLTDEPFSNEHQIIPLSQYMHIPKILLVTMWQVIGKFAGTHLWHTTMMWKSLEYYNILNVIIWWTLAKHWFTSYEIQQILNKVFTDNQLIFGNLIQYEGEYFVNINGLIQQVNLEESAIILWKDRLPEWFTKWPINDPKLIDFKANNPHSTTMPLKGSHMFGTVMRAPDVKMLDQHGNQKYISSSDYRAWVLNNKLYSKSTVQSRFDPQIAWLFTQSDNVKIIKQRLINWQWWIETTKRTSDQIKDNYKQTYTTKWWESDFYTEDGKDKAFNGNTPKGNHKSEKKSFIEKMQWTIKTQLDEIKEAYKAKDIGQLQWIEY